MSKIIFNIIYLAFIITTLSFSQENDSNISYVLKGKIIDGDTIPHINLDEVYVFSFLSYDNWWHKWKYRRLIRNIKAVYPYAKLARKKFQEMNEHYLSLETEREKRNYMNNLEKEVMDEFGEELMKLTITQGRLLIKLIDRETGQTSYEILKEYKGSVSAFFWQTLARLFGSDLKSEYDPLGKDRIIEELIFLYEKGLL